MANPEGAGPPVGGVSEFLPRPRALPKERLWGMATPNGVGPPAKGTGSPAQAVVAVGGVDRWVGMVTASCSKSGEECAGSPDAKTHPRALRMGECGTGEVSTYS